MISDDSRNTSLMGNHRKPLQVSGQRSMVEYQRFSDEYFSGCDVAIYFGDVLVDEIESMQFEMYEQVFPIYGYASYTFDDVARGQRAIQGSFKITFKEEYYIHAIANQIESSRNSGTIINKPFEFQNWHRESTIEGILAGKKNLSGAEFENLAEEYEKSIWGEGNEAFKQRVNTQENTSYFFPKGRQDSLKKNGFNIMITYGAMEREQAQPINGTICTLVGVQLTGRRQIIAPTGDAISEEYSFIARDIDGDFSKIGKTR